MNQGGPDPNAVNPADGQQQGANPAGAGGAPPGANPAGAGGPPQPTLQQLMAVLVAQNANMTQAMTNMNNMLTVMANNAAGAAAAPPAANPTIDVHAGGSPYDTKRKDSFQAFQEACAALPQTYDGTNEKYPAFIVALKQKTMHCFWNDPTTGIITIAGKSESI